MKTLALISHDGKKPEMVAFVKDNLELIKKFKLIATGTTGRYVEEAGLKVQKVESGPRGGDAQIAAMIGAFSLVMANSDRTSWARLINSCTAP